MINSFTGRYHFLSNFYVNPLNGKSVEHYYQAAKTDDVVLKASIMASISPGVAKRRGNGVVMRKGFEEEKLEIMYNLVSRKFAESAHLKSLLLATGDEELVEGNTWGDTFWGVNINTGAGENHLGKILMQVRKDLRDA